MIINYIVLENFRQYKGNQKITFSTDTKKNVTVIKGENGAGKTTLLQAFKWCLYGDKGINLPNEKKLLTAELLNELKNNEESSVRVELSFIHNSKEYIISRESYFKKNLNNEINKYRNDRKILQEKQADGTLKEISNFSHINNIIPSDLSTYFFFDGERIENISKSNRDGKKDLNIAIRNILGLDVILNGKKHLNSIKKDLIDQYDSEANSEIDNIRKALCNIENKRKDILLRRKTISDENYIIHNKLLEVNNKLKEYKELKFFQQERETKEEKCESKEQKINDIKNNIQKDNKRYLPQYIAKKLLDIYKDKINLESLESKGIVGIDAKAIECLINRGECICGQKIKEGTSHYNNLIEQKEYQPPASLSTIINQFNEKTNRIKNDADEYYKEINIKLNNLDSIKEKINHLKEEIDTIGEKMSTMKNGSNLEQQRTTLLRNQIKNENSLEKLKEEEEDLLKEEEDLNVKLKLITKNNEKNKLIALRQVYTDKLLKEMSDFYDRKEKTIKKELNTKVTNIFSNLLCTRHRIEIQEDYTFKVIDIDGEESTSQGQDVITSFAFISGIISLAKEKHKDIEVNEPYPLIMDAPFAKLSKTHRTNVANLLPNIAEQFILITVDSQYEGDIEDTLCEKIGKKYDLVMHNESEKYTEIVAVEV